MNWPHIHLALNHVPVLGFVFLFLLLLIGFFKQSNEIKKLSLQGLFVLAIVSIPIKFTGDFASESAAFVPPLDSALVKKHEDTADQAAAAIFVTGLAAMAGLIASRKSRDVPKWAMIVALATSLITFLLLVRTANAGGQIRHPEIRPSHST